MGNCIAGCREDTLIYLISDITIERAALAPTVKRSSFMAANLENKLLAVVRVRGTVGVRRSIRETLSRLNLKRVNNMVLLYGTKTNLGMIKMCNDFVTYGEVDSDFIGKVLEKKGIKAKKEDVSALAAGKKSAKEIADMPIRLHPPIHGYEGIKFSYTNKGALGYRGAAISKLIARMT